MLNEDASQAGSTGNSAPVARADVDTLPAGSYGPATGNAITGAGTSTGSAGADSATPPAHIVSVQGAGGPTAQANGNFQANGQYGVLTMDAQGDFNYVRNPGTPDGVRDVFNYTLADASGANSSTTLTIDIGQIAAAAASQNVINLPAGVQLSDIHVNGRDLVINMPDGTQMVIPNGAVFVPDLVIGDVSVPPTNLASLLIDSEPQPAAGQNQSSGGNFAEPVPPLDPGVPLGDLIPPTELTYVPPEFRPIGQFENTKPTVVFEPHDVAPGVVDAVDSVSEKGLPARDGNLPNEPAGTGEIADGNATNDSDPSEHTFGQIVFTAGDGLKSITVDGVSITASSVGTTIVGQFGTMTITSVDLAHGTIGYNYVLTDNNLLGDISADHFTVVVTDSDGDTATATLTVDIIDDAPIARNDTDAVAKGSDSTDGNVLTGANTTSGVAGADTPGADNIPNGVTGIHSGTSGAFTNVTSGGVLVHGTLGDLVIHADGSYTYTVTASNGTPGGNDVFTYQITDGDGDTSTATLTITVPADSIPVPNNATALVDDDGLPLGNHDHAPGDDTQSPDPDNNETTVSGTLTANLGGDGPGTFTFAAGTDGSTATIGQETVTYHLVGDVLTAEVTTSPDAARVGTDLFSVTIHSDGTYSIQLIENVLQIDDHTNTENNADTSITFTVTDSDGDHANGTLTISFDDDIPTAIIPPPPEEGGPPTPLVSGQVDEDALATGNGDSAPGDDPGGASASGLAGSLGALFNAGADQPLSFSLSSVTTGLPDLTSNGHAVTYAVAGNVLTASADLNGDGHIGAGETIFTLTVNSNGSWTFNLEGQLDHPTGAGTPADNTEDPNLLLDLSSIIVATDSDGDSATAAPGAFVIDVDDDMPAQVAGSVTAHVDEDELPLGNTDNDAQTTVATGSLASQVHVGADQPGTFSLDASALGSLPALTSNGAAIHYAIVGGELVAYTGADSSQNHVFTVDLSSNGNFTVTLLAQVDHLPNSPANDDNQNLTLDLSGLVQVTDADGDSIHLDPRSFLVQIEDDIPTQTGSTVTAHVDEDELPGGNTDNDAQTTVATGSLSSLASVGADQPGTFAFDANALGGLPALTSNGAAIHYAVVGGELVAYTGADSSTNHVFTVSLTANGNFTVTLLDQVDHLPNSPANDDNQILTLDLSGAVTVTDADGDSIHLDAGSFNVAIEDDIPTQTSAVVTAHVDEDELPNGITDNDAQTTVATGSLSTLVSVGADQPGTFTFDSGALGGLPALTSGGAAIHYAVVGSTLVAYTGADSSLNHVFTISLTSNGNFTVTLLEQVDHLPNSPANDDNQVLTLDLSGIVQVTDADGDSIHLDAGSFNVQIEDDIPIARNDTDEITGGGTTATGNVITGVGTTSGVAGADSSGADAPATIIAVSSASHGTDTTFSSGVLSIAGDHGTLEIHANGDYTYTRTDNVGGVTDTFTYTIQDADGDTTTATLTIGIEDKIPTLATPGIAQIDDDALAGGNAGGTGDDGPPNPGNPDVATGTLVGSGGDGTLTYHFAATQDGLPSGFTVDGTSTATHMVIDQNGTPVITVDLNTATGAYTVTQIAPIMHPTLDGQTGDNTENNITDIGVKFFVTDSDGDPSNTVTLTINSDDDTPTINVTQGSDAAVSLTTDDADTIGANSDTSSSSANFGGVFGLSFSAGADGTNTTPTLAYALNVSSQGVDSALDSHGSSIFLYKDAGGNIIGSTSSTFAGISSGNTIFEVSVSGTGVVTLTQFQQIDHPIGSDPTPTGTPFNDQSVSLADGLITLTASSSITDKDGDTATDSETVGIGANLHFTDDGPSATIATTGQAISVDETPGVQADANDVAGPLAVFAGVTNVGVDPDMPAQYASNANAILTTTGTAFGADGPGTTVLSLNVSSAGVDSGLNTTDGHDILLFKEGNLIVGRVSGGADDGKAAFAISVDQTGHLSMVEYLSIQHPNTASADESVSINNTAIVGVVTATDFDGDTSSSSVAIGNLISFQDDGPTLGAFTDATIQNAVGHVDGTYAFDWGADGFGGFVSVTGPAIPGITYTTTTDADGGVTLHANSGTTEVFSLDVHPDGTYTFDLITPDAGSTVTQSLLGLKSGQNDFIQTNDGLVEMTPDDHNGNDTGTVNSSTVGFGNGNQFTGNGEAITFEFHSTNQAGDQSADTNPNFVSSVTLTAPSNGFNGTTETITWFATNTETHQTATGTIQVDTNTNELVITPGFDFNELTIEGSNADGNGIRLTQISETTTILPQSEDLTFNVQAKDGDGDPTGTSSFTVHVTVDSQSQAAVQQTQLFSQTALNTSSLVSSNDNDNGRNTGGHNTVLMGAIAAAGLSAFDAGVGSHMSFHDVSHIGMVTSVNHSVADVLPFNNEAAGTFLSSHFQQSSVVPGSNPGPQGGGTVHDMVDTSHALTTAGADAHPTTELLNGTTVPGQSGADGGNHMMAPAIVMPSAQQLAAAMTHGGSAQPLNTVAGGQHDEVVGKVLADALHGGGGSGPNIDALINTLPDHAGTGGNLGLETFASLGSGTVPLTHIPGAGAFAGPHSMISVEMVMHADAPPHAHG